LFESPCWIAPLVSGLSLHARSSRSAHVLIQTGECDYRILGPEGEESPIVPYGETAVLKIEEAVYYCHIEDADDLSPVVYRVDKVTRMQSEEEEVEFPPAVVAALRNLDDAIEAQAAVIDATVEELAGPEESD
jgi:hypothetical protein